MEVKSKYDLPKWNQKANELRRVRGVRDRLKKELNLLNSLAKQHGVPTEGRAAMDVLSDLEWLVNQATNSSPTYAEYRHG